MALSAAGDLSSNCHRGPFACSGQRLFKRIVGEIRRFHVLTPEPRAARFLCPVAAWMHFVASEGGRQKLLILREGTNWHKPQVNECYGDVSTVTLFLWVRIPFRSQHAACADPSPGWLQSGTAVQSRKQGAASLPSRSLAPWA